MAIMRLYKYDEEILRRKMKPVDPADIKKRLGGIISDMFETMLANEGIGLAANQVGLDMRLAIIKIPQINEDIAHEAVLINPVIVEKTGIIREDEGCLSFPGIFARVPRAQKVIVHFFNESGMPDEIKAEGIFAKALQHEIDHLDGICFIDRLSPAAKLKIKIPLAKLKAKTARENE